MNKRLCQKDIQMIIYLGSNALTVQLNVAETASSKVQSNPILKYNKPYSQRDIIIIFPKVIT